MILPTLLAQAENVPAESIKTAALIVAAVLASGYYLLEMFMRVRKLMVGEKTDIIQPLEIKHADKFVPKDEFAKHTDWDADEHAKIWRKFEEEQKAATLAGTARSDKIYGQINDVRRELDGKLDKQTERLEAKLDGLEARIVTTLKNTGAI